MTEATGGNVMLPGSHRDFVNIPIKYEERLAKVPKTVDHFRYPSNDPLLVRFRSFSQVPLTFLPHFSHFAHFLRARLATQRRSRSLPTWKLAT